MTAPSYASAIRLARIAKGLTQQQVADHIGHSNVYVSQVESGVRGPFTYDVNVKLYALLGLEWEPMRELELAWEKK